MKTTYILLFALIAFFSLSCNDDEKDPELEAKNPVEELDWLAAMADELGQNEFAARYFFIVSAEYESNTVFIIKNCCAHCNTAVPVYDYEGQFIGFLGTGGNHDFPEVDPNDISETKTVWTGPDFLCQLQE